MATTALLVIDVQVGIIDGARPAYARDAVLAQIALLRARARAADAPIIYIQHDGDPGESLAPDAPGWAIHPAVAPDDEPVIRKRASDSFFETPLHEQLAARGIRRLVITGCRTERCVDTTCRRATTLGYDVTLAADAHTTTDGAILPAAQIVAFTNDNLDDFGTDHHVITVQPAAVISFD